MNLIADEYPARRYGLQTPNGDTACLRREGAKKGYCGKSAPHDVPDGNPRRQNGTRQVKWHCVDCSKVYRAENPGYFAITYDI